MNILIITQHFPPEIGACSNRINYMSFFLCQLGHKLTIITSEPSYPSKDMYDSTQVQNLDMHKNIRVYRTKTPFKSYSGNSLKRLLLYIWFVIMGTKKIKDINSEYDLIITTSPPIFTGIIGIIAKKKFKSKLFLDIRDLWPSSIEAIGKAKQGIFLKLAYKFEKYLYNKADRIIINSRGFKDEIVSKNKNEEKIIYLPNGLSLRDIEYINYDILIKKRDHFINIIYAGNLGYAQGMESFLQISKAMTKFKNVRIIILGGGAKYAELKESAMKMGTKNIIFLGPVPLQQVRKILRKAHIAFVHLDDKRVFETVIPSKIFDYMASGLPIVAGVKGQAAKIIRESEAGLISNPYDKDNIISNIVKLIDNKSLRISMGMNGYKYLKSNFLWDENIKVLNDILVDMKEGEMKC